MTSENTLRHPGTAGVNDPGYPHDGPWIPPCPSTASRSFDPNRISLRGRLVCHGPAPRVITYESQLERKTALVLLARPDVVSVHDQPKPVTYTDVLGNESRHTCVGR
ncbi:hypothetical protein [Methylobacterium sp.]|uniref:hypothetical protein n=1 Tax=Methylobacterium sp. TaxID=409 RepID=UPI003B01A46F